MGPAPENPSPGQEPTVPQGGVPLNRRAVLKLGTAAAAVGAGGLTGLLGATGATGQTAVEPGDQNPFPDHVIRHEYGFVLDIPDAPDASKNIREIAINALTIDVSRNGPTRADFGEATFVFAASPASRELQLWFDDAAKGKCIRKDISIILLKRDGSPGRTYNLMNCFPTQYSSINFDTSSTVQTETMTVKVGRIEFKT